MAEQVPVFGRKAGRPLDGVRQSVFLAAETGKLLRAYLRQTGRVATGALDKSFQVVVQSPKVGLVAAPYLLNALFGRKPTKGGGDGALRKALIPWIRIKIGAVEDINRVAYIIAKKIHEEGYPGVATQATIEAIQEAAWQRSEDFVADSYMQETLVEIDEVLKNFNKVGTVKKK